MVAHKFSFFVTLTLRMSEKKKCSSFYFARKTSQSKAFSSEEKKESF
jgi:hypothetical protein